MEELQSAPKQEPSPPGRPDRREELRRQRELTTIAPSGLEVTIRPVNLESHALAGGLPSRIKAIASGGVQSIDAAIRDATEEGDFELRQYLDKVVCATFIDPEFSPPVYATEDDDAKGWKRGAIIYGDDLDEYLLPVDYRWALLIAMGEEDRDGEGRRLWGREPLSRWATFREEHRCQEDCEACHRTGARFSALRPDGRPIGAPLAG